MLDTIAFIIFFYIIKTYEMKQGKEKDTKRSKSLSKQHEFDVISVREP